MAALSAFNIRKGIFSFLLLSTQLLGKARLVLSKLKISWITGAVPSDNMSRLYCLLFNNNNNNNNNLLAYHWKYARENNKENKSNLMKLPLIADHYPAKPASTWNKIPNIWMFPSFHWYVYLSCKICILFCLLMRQQRRYSQCINDCQAQYVPLLLGNYDYDIRMKIIALLELTLCKLANSMILVNLVILATLSL